MMSAFIKYWVIFSRLYKSVNREALFAANKTNKSESPINENSKEKVTTQYNLMESFDIK